MNYLEEIKVSKLDYYTWKIGCVLLLGVIIWNLYVINEKIDCSSINSVKIQDKIVFSPDMLNDIMREENRVECYFGEEGKCYEILPLYINKLNENVTVTRLVYSFAGELK